MKTGCGDAVGESGAEAGLAGRAESVESCSSQKLKETTYPSSVSEENSRDAGWSVCLGAVARSRISRVLAAVVLAIVWTLVWAYAFGGDVNHRRRSRALAGAMQYDGEVPVFVVHVRNDWDRVR